MKKILSLALAFVLMFTICVPVFALNMENPVGSTSVRVNGSTVGASYTVTIPATATISWGQTEKEIEYSIYSQLSLGEAVKVTVTQDADGKMKNAENTAFLEYSLKEGTTEYTARDSVILPENAEKTSVVVQIPTENWEKASIDNYVGTLTFLAELEDVPYDFPSHDSMDDDKPTGNDNPIGDNESTGDDKPADDEENPIPFA